MTTFTSERNEIFKYEYTPDGLLKSITYPALKVIGQTSATAKKVTYTYDTHQRLSTVKDWKNRTTTYKYDLAGRLVEILRPNGSLRTLAYDAGDRLKEIKEAWVTGDKNTKGRLIALFRFDVDAAGRVTRRLGAPYPYGTAAGFEAVADADNRLMSVNGQPLGYDLDGNLLSAPDPLYGGVMQLGYNSRNQLTSASLRGVSAAFTYDAEGVRQTMTTGSGASSTTTYYTSTPHGPLSQVVARYEKSSVDNGGALMYFDGGGIHWAVYGHGLLYEVVETINGSGKPVESEVLYYHTDQVGSTVAVTNQARQDVLWVQYDAHGAVTEAVSPTQRDGKPAARPGLNEVADKLQRALSVTPYLYCGEHGVMTDRTGLIHMRARYYHPGLRRFVNPDPIGFAGGMNWYGYAGGGPVMAVDPSGEAIWIPAVLIGLYFFGTDTANAPAPGDPTYASNGAAKMIGATAVAMGGAAVTAAGQSAYAYAAMHPGATMTITAALDQSGTIAAVGGASALAWNSRPPGVQVAQIGDWFVKTVNPQSNKLMQWWGQQSINAQHKALIQLGDMAVENFMSNGALYTRSVGQVLGNGSRFTNATSLNAYLEGSKKIGYFNDIQPRNMGANGKIFDPAIDWVTKSLFYAGGAAAAGGAGYLGYRATCVR